MSGEPGRTAEVARLGDTPRRPGPGADPVLVVMVVLLAVSAALLLAFGLERAAAGVGAGTPVALVNHWWLARTRGRMEKLSLAQGTRQLLLTYWGRLGLDLVALLVATRFGAEFLIGVLIALVTEMMAYVWDQARRLGRG